MQPKIAVIVLYTAVQQHFVDTHVRVHACRLKQLPETKPDLANVMWRREDLRWKEVTYSQFNITPTTTSRKYDRQYSDGCINTRKIRY